MLLACLFFLCMRRTARDPKNHRSGEASRQVDRPELGLCHLSRSPLKPLSSSTSTTTESSLAQVGSRAPTLLELPSPPPQMKPKSMKLPSLLKAIQPITIDRQDGEPAKPTVHEKSVRRRSLMIEAESDSRLGFSKASAVTSKNQATVHNKEPTQNIARNLNLRPPRLFSLISDQLSRISEESPGGSGGQTPKISPKATARTSVVSNSIVMLQAGPGTSAHEARLQVLRAENERLRGEIDDLRTSVRSASQPSKRDHRETTIYQKHRRR